MTKEYFGAIVLTLMIITCFVGSGYCITTADESVGNQAWFLFGYGMTLLICGTILLVELIRYGFFRKD